ncbi:Uncharacterized protein DBV15_11013 [Temnothorax longispinosus]|uniref:Uncharacterized protein n=1 Tax=Temnothorax longispinosus TaxID=300112 RepID=A0A4V3SB50_9HYME|nr:Uncharacterized protein DBV15_11013 [Temnothorax longispinosus]
MPAAHLPTPANLPNLNAKSAGAPPVRWRRERDGEQGGARARRGTGKANRGYERQKDRYRKRGAYERARKGRSARGGGRAAEERYGVEARAEGTKRESEKLERERNI